MNHIAKALVCSALILSVFSGGCSFKTAARDKKDERNPTLKRAKEKKNAKDIEGAITLYQRALDKDPRIARAHLELGLIYDQYREDYVRAIYHYERYLELRPDAEKKALIQDLVRHARISFAASLPEKPSGAIEEIAMLKREVATLETKLLEAQERGNQARASAAAPAQPKVAANVPKPAPAQPSVQTYRVQSGDTLSSIASKMYDDKTRWKDIYEANRTKLPNAKTLKVGQTLIIPRG